MTRRFDSSKTTLIYRLIDPRDGQTRYVGYTQRSLSVRWREHRDSARDNPKYYRDFWIRSILDDGDIPHIEELDFGVWSEEIASYREDYWISSFRSRGAQLTNMKPGGIGTRDITFSEESRKRLSEISLANWQRDEYRELRARQMAEYWNGNDRARAAVARQVADRWKDPNYSTRQTLASDEYRERRSAIAQEIFSRPEMLSMLADNGKKSAKLRRQCNECGKISSPMGIGSHQRAGHSGFTDLPALGGDV